MELNSILLACDGSCALSGARAGFIGWACILKFGEVEREMSGTHDSLGTNATAELLAALHGLEAIKRPCKVELVSDSEFLLKGLCGLNDEPAWIDRWIAKGYKTSTGGKVKNEELWRKLYLQKKIHQITPHWIKGHQPLYKQNEYHKLNARCDELAVREAVMAFEKSLQFDSRKDVAYNIATDT